MRAILIDPKTLNVTEVQVSKDYTQIYEQIECQTFTAIQINDKGDMLYIDDEGLLVDLTKQVFFRYDDYPTPLAGKGIIIGSTRNGNPKEPTITVLEVTSKVSYLTLYQVQMWSRDHPEF